MYTILFDINDTGWKLASKTVSTFVQAQQMVDTLSNKGGIRNVRLLQDVVESPYEKLYYQLYEDFVRQYANTANVTEPDEVDGGAVEIR